MKILVVEDEKKIASFVARGLKEQGWTVDLCHDGEDGLHLAQTQEYDAMVLDIMLPGRDGLSVLRHLRQRRSALPVLLLTARDSLEERVEGLERGADDYLTKPFYMEELVARLKALMRRGGAAEPSLRQAGGLTIDLMKRELRRGDELIALTAREFNLLEYLTRSPGRVLTRTQILEHVWDYHFDPNTNIVDVYIKRLRKKIDPPGGDSPIETVRGVGYRLREDSPA